MPPAVNPPRPLSVLVGLLTVAHVHRGVSGCRRWWVDASQTSRLGSMGARGRTKKGGGQIPKRRDGAYRGREEIG